MRSSVILVVLVIILTEDSVQITRFINRRPYQDEWRPHRERAEESIQYTRKYEPEDVRAPRPQLEWEDALRHSIYLTLVRDRIDAILTRRGPANSGDDDAELWREIKRAPFRVRQKERGPIFGDIAILSRGKMVRTERGFQLLEDENAKECIECHIYSARLNELEAEKRLGTRCRGLDCPNSPGSTVALWTVRRIRHRNRAEEGSPYRYELMFSIASAAGRVEDGHLDYNAPTQTFTINENSNLDDAAHPSRESEFWSGGVSSNKPFVFPQENHHRNGNKGEDRKQLPNFSEVYNDESKYSIDTKRPNYYHGNEHYELSSKQKTNKKYKAPSLEKQTRPATITHLHHHYYLNDGGMPIVNLPHIESNDFSRRPEVDDTGRDTPKSASKMSTNTFNNQAPIVSKNVNKHSWNVDGFPYNYTDVYETTTTSGIRMTLQKALANNNRLNVVPTKPFKPSPEDVRVKYSEPDPLYTPAVDDTLQIHTTLAVDNNFEDREKFATPTSSITQSLNEFSVIINDAAHGDNEEDVTNFTPTQRHTEETTTKRVTTTTAQTKKVNRFDKSYRRRKVERGTRKPLRQTKSRKRISEIADVQLHPPNVTTDTTTAYSSTESDSLVYNTLTLSNTTKIDSPIISTNASLSRDNFGYKTRNGNYSTRNPRIKYQRKSSSNWSPRKIKVQMINTTPGNVITSNVNTESSVKSSTVTIDKYSTKTNQNNEIKEEFTIDSNNATFERDYSTVVNEENKTFDEKLNDVTVLVSTENYETSAFPNNDNKVTIDNDDNIESTISTPSELRFSTTLINPVNENTSDFAESEELFTPLTKKSLVTSISVKLGNKTRPYVSHTVPSETHSNVTERNIFLDSILNQYDLVSGTKAKIHEINKNESEFKIFMAEDSLNNTYLHSQNEAVDNITQQILEHAKQVYNRTKTK